MPDQFLMNWTVDHQKNILKMKILSNKLRERVKVFAISLQKNSENIKIHFFQLKMSLMMLKHIQKLQKKYQLLGTNLGLSFCLYDGLKQKKVIKLLIHLSHS